MKNKKLYAQAIRWIADNDEPLDMDPESISGFISTALTADLFGVTVDKVAEDVVIVRLAIEKGACGGPPYDAATATGMYDRDF